MANEFVARKGLIVSGSTNISGSVTASYFKGDGSQLTNLPSTNVASAVIVTNTFTGDGTTATFNLGGSYIASSLMVSVDGLFYTPSADFTVSNGDIIFTSAPPSASDITVRAMVNIVSGGVGTYSGSFIGNLTGSIYGTSSWATSASSAITASYALNAGAGAGFPFSGSAVITGSLLVVSTGSVGGVTASLQGTSSWAEQAITASYASTAELLDGKDSTTFATTGSNTFIGTQVFSGSINFESGSSISRNSHDLEIKPGTTGQLLLFSNDSAHYISIDSASVTATDLTVLTGITGSLFGTSSWASKAISSSYATTASYALNAGAGAGFPFSGSAVITGSLLVVATGSVGGITGSFSGDGSNITNLNVSTAVVSDIYKFVGNGSTQTYIVSQSYLATNVQVAVDGLVFTEGVDYAYTTGSIVFVLAPPSSSNILITGLLNTQTNLSGSFSGSFIGDGSGLTNIKSLVAVDAYKFTGDGSTYSYVLSQSYYNNNTLLISVGGISYTATEDYSVSSNTLTFTEAPPSGSLIAVRAFVNTSSGSAGTFSGSFIGTASYATSASFATTSSYASNVLKTKAGSIAYTSFGGTPYSASVTFSTVFPNTNFAVIVTGEDARAWTVESKTVSGFTVNTNSNTALTGTTYWTCTAYGEN